MACFAPQAKKAIFQNTALQKRSKFVFDEPRSRAIPFLLPRQKRFQFRCDNRVQDRLLWSARTIDGRRTFHAVRPAIAEPRGRANDSMGYPPTANNYREKADNFFRAFPETEMCSRGQHRVTRLVGLNF